MLSGAVSFVPATYAAGNVIVGGKATVVNTGGDNLRVRAGAGTKFDQVAEAHEGEVVSVLSGPGKDGKGDSWYKVSGPGGTGWIRVDFLSGKAGSAAAATTKVTAKAAAATPKIAGFAKVANSDGDQVRMRQAAGSSAGVLALLGPGAPLAVKQGPVIDRDGVAWYQVSGETKTGWVMAKYLVQTNGPGPAKPAAAAPAQPAAEAQPAVQTDEARTGTSRGAEPPAAISSGLGQAIVSVAMKFQGYRYRFGGTSPRGFDCSGFLYYVVNHAGKSLARDLYSQLNSGTRVSASNLQPGDLLFFSNTYKRGLSHAGIYIGNGKFIHAENESTGVAVSALWSAYWAAHYTGATRVR
jgi:cell wall-associated NlpC family hydrolase